MGGGGVGDLSGPFTAALPGSPLGSLWLPPRWAVCCGSFRTLVRLRLCQWEGGWAAGATTIVSVQPGVRAGRLPRGASSAARLLADARHHQPACWPCRPVLAYNQPPGPGTTLRGPRGGVVWPGPGAGPCTQLVRNKYEPTKKEVCVGVEAGESSSSWKCSWLWACVESTVPLIVGGALRILYSSTHVFILSLRK